MNDDRDERGRFVAGNAGGPGRPRRAIEREYLAVISEALPLEDWREIVAHAVDVAKQGDDKARAWLTKFVIGDNPISLTELLAREVLDVSPDREVAARVDEINNPPSFLDWGNAPTLIERAVNAIKAEQQAAIEQQEAEERARKRAERTARKAAQDARESDETTTGAA